MTTRIEQQRIVPRFRSRQHALWWLKHWYYPSRHWQEVRQLVYAYYQGRCKECKKLVGSHWQAHHEQEAYNYLWQEARVLHLMALVHPECHKKIEHKKALARKLRPVKNRITRLSRAVRSYRAPQKP